jgi:apolipoprotein N-acyltransferase
MKKVHLLLLSLLSGLLLAAAWPLRGFTPLIFVAFVPLFFIQQHLGDTGKKGMFGYAWLTFLIWNGLTTWWIWNATPTGAVMAIILISLFMAFVFQVFHLSKKWLFGNAQGFGILIFYWISWEYFNMHWQLSWTWLTLGNVFASKHLWIQWYEYTGVLGGTLWILVANILAYNIVRNVLSEQKRKIVLNSALMVLLIGTPIILSLNIYHHYKETKNPVNVVAVQPNTDPYTEEFNLPPSVLIQRNLKLADEKVNDSTDYVVFPESTIQEDIWEGSLDRSPSLKTLRNYVQEHPNLSMVIGASTFRWLKPGAPRTNAARLYRKNLYYYAYNTAFYIDQSPFIQVHHKSKLVPGVEEMPSWPILQPLEKFAINLGGTVGTLKKDDHISLFTNDSTGDKIAPMICYESVYGDFVSHYVRQGAELIFVITNDGWWGNTPGYRQHFSFAVLRSIETRRDVVQSSTTGYSGFVNQRGDVLQRTKYGVPAVLSQTMNLNDTLTYYVKKGDYLARLAGFFSLLILLASIVQGILRKQKLKL